MPFINRFTRFVERLLPERISLLTRGLDPAALATPVVALEAERRTVALALEVVCGAVVAALAGEKVGAASAGQKSVASATDAAAALGEAQDFLSQRNGAPESKEERHRRIGALRALDHAARFAEIAGETPQRAMAKAGPEDIRASELCADAMRNAAAVVRLIAEESALSDHAAPIESMDTPETNAALARLAQCAKGLSDLRQVHRAATLKAVGAGELNADQALVRVDAVRRLDAMAHHAWRANAHLAGRAA